MSSVPHPLSWTPPTIKPILPSGVSPPQGISPFTWQFPPFRPPSRITLINTGKLESELLGHTDHSVADYVLKDLRYGFHLGFNPATVSLGSSSQNMVLALLQPEVLDNYLLVKIDKGTSPPLANLRTSGFGVIPKKHQLG